jgi:hypothetical protein
MDFTSHLRHGHDKPREPDAIGTIVTDLCLLDMGSNQRMEFMTVLPWVLFIILNGETEVPTPMKYATYEECMKDGAILAMTIKVDLMLTNHVLEPKCVKKP